MTVERRRLAATLVFDLEDVYSRERAVRGPHPRPIGSLRFRLVGEVIAGVRQDFDEPRDLLTSANPSGYHLFFGAVRLGKGQWRRIDLAAGIYVVAVESDFYQLAEREDIVVPQLHPAPGPYRFDLQPGYAYPFPRERVALKTPPRVVDGPTLLRGALHSTAGLGVAGATVEVTGESNLYRTDDTGRWVLVFPDTQLSGNVTVRFHLPGHSPEDVVGVPVEPGRERSLQQTALRGFVTQGGAPANGARVRVVGRPGETRTTSDGGWSYYFPLNEGASMVDVEALLDGGPVLANPNVKIQPRSTVVVETFRF